MKKAIDNKIFRYSVDPIYIDNTKTLLKQMKHCICRIKNGDKISTGFFCNIELDKMNKKRCLFTSYNIINDNDIKERKRIELFFNNNKEYKLIKLDNNRKIYSFKNFGVRIFIIQNTDNINNDKNYLDLDENLLNNKISYTNKSIYILENRKGNKNSAIFGKIKEINESKISHICKVENDIEGSPILNLTNNKVIGIQNNNYGIFLRTPIQELIKDKKKLNDNEIDAFLKTIICEKTGSIKIIGRKKYPNQAEYIDEMLIEGLMRPKNKLENIESFLIKKSKFKLIKEKNVIEKQIDIKLLGEKKINNLLNTLPQKKKFVIPKSDNRTNQIQIKNNLQPDNSNHVPLNNNMNMINNDKKLDIGKVNQNNMNFKWNNNNNPNDFGMQIQNIEKGVLINERYSSKLCKDSKKKINVTFTYQKPKTFIVDLGTTIHDLLINYLKYMGMLYIFDYISFIFNASRLNINDKRPIEKISYSVDMRITVSVSDLIVLKHFTFQTTSNIRLKLVFDNYSTNEELLKAFFDEVGKPELFGKEDKINFLYNAEKIKYKEKEIIEATFTDNNPRIIVLDTNNLITGN